MIFNQETMLLSLKQNKTILQYLFISCMGGLTACMSGHHVCERCSQSSEDLQGYRIIWDGSYRVLAAMWMLGVDWVL